MVRSVPQEVEPPRGADFALAGSLHLEFRRCGKPSCRCANSTFRHGPYVRPPVARRRPATKRRSCDPRTCRRCSPPSQSGRALGSAAQIVKKLAVRPPLGGQCARDNTGRGGSTRDALESHCAHGGGKWATPPLDTGRVCAMLSKEQKTFYDDNGYLLIENAVSSAQLETLRRIK